MLAGASPSCTRCSVECGPAGGTVFSAVDSEVGVAAEGAGSANGGKKSARIFQVESGMDGEMRTSIEGKASLNASKEAIGTYSFWLLRTCLLH